MKGRRRKNYIGVKERGEEMQREGNAKEKGEKNRKQRKKRKVRGN